MVPTTLDVDAEIDACVGQVERLFGRMSDDNYRFVIDRYIDALQRSANTSSKSEEEA